MLAPDLQTLVNSYAYRVQFDHADCIFVGCCEELGLQVFAPSNEAALTAIKQAVDEHIRSDLNAGQYIPLPNNLLSDIINRYSYQVSYSQLAKIFVAICLELQTVDFGSTQESALNEVKLSAASVLSDLFFQGKTIPEPLNKFNF